MDADLTLQYRIAITFSSRLNNRIHLPFIEEIGGIEALFLEKERVLMKTISEKYGHSLKLDRSSWLKQAEKEMDVMHKEGIHCVCWESHNYPKLLHNCPDAPLVMYYKGTLDIEKKRTLAIVGTRKASDRCKARVESIVRQLSEMNYSPVIISGLAYGIDVTAHQAALRHKLTTQAVLGHGLNMIYPATHKGVAEKIIQQKGCLISEFPSSARILPINFLQRNRIIAGMSEAILIAESAAKGGAMATARQAFSYDRNVMAIPGRPEDRSSNGCNRLIKENIAFLVEEAADILPAFNWNLPLSRPIQTSLDLFAEPEQEASIKKTLEEHGTLQIDQLSLLSGIPIPELSPLLLKLELEGVIQATIGNHFSLI